MIKTELKEMDDRGIFVNFLHILFIPNKNLYRKIYIAVHKGTTIITLNIW